MIVDEENGSEFEAITMDGGPFDSLTITRLEDGGIKLSIDRDAVVWKQHAEGTMCAEDVARLAEWLIPTRDNALAAMTQRAEAAEAELRESERDLSDMAANSNRLHAIAEQMRQRANTVVAEYSEKLVAATQRAEAAEREAMVYRVLLTGAMIRAAFENKATDYGKFSVEYFTGLFGVALNSGGFFDEGCEWPEIQRAAKLLHVDLPVDEAQP